MAYLRGSSYVDGDLIVEGSLKVKRLAFADDEIVFYPADISTSLKEDYLVRFASTDGALDYAPISVTSSSSSATIALKTPNITIVDYTDSTLSTTESILSITHTNNEVTAVLGTTTLSVDRITVYDAGLRLVESGEDIYWEADV